MGNIDSDRLVRLIDDLSPINNQFRTTTEAVPRIELMWEFGRLLDETMRDTGSHLHELLLTIYDPHSTKKMSYITRDLGSYSYRVFKYFPKKGDIRSQLPNLKHYSLFREAIPLLFNDKYKLAKEDKEKVLKLIQSTNPSTKVQNHLKKMKQAIVPVKNPRNQLAQKYQEERDYLVRLEGDVYEIYKNNESRPEKVDVLDGMRPQYVRLVMSLAMDAFQASAAEIKPNTLDEPGQRLLKISQGSSRDRSRFRKWSFDSNRLLMLAEGLNALDSENDYRFFRQKVTESKTE